MTLIRKYQDLLNDVSIHTPTKGVTFYCYQIGWIRDSFNPHTHEGCDAKEYVKDGYKVVSIHTPTKGVTYNGAPFLHSVFVSIHTPTKGVTGDRAG